MQVYYSLRYGDNIFNYSPTAVSKGIDYFYNLFNSENELYDIVNKSELDLIVQEVLSNYPIDDDKVVSYNTKYPNGYVDAETMRLIQEAVRSVV